MDYFEQAGVYDPQAPDADQVRLLVLWLVEMGMDPADIVAAANQCALSALAADHALRPLDEFSMRDAANELGISVEQLDELRRHSGLSARQLDEPAFAKSEVEGFRGLVSGSSMFTPEEANHFSRVLGSSLARIADAAVSLFLIDIEGPLRAAGGSQLDIARRNLEAMDALDGVASAMDPLLRLHIEDAVKRSRAARTIDEDPHTVRMAVGFVDLVGFTAFSGELDQAELGVLVRRFEDAAYDIVTEHGGRVVKLIGDEVMFVAVDPADSVTIALALIDEFRERQGVTPRGGLAWGRLLSRGGDYYGPIVNLASRIGDLAVPCELLATPELAELAPAYAFEPAGRRQLKGFADPMPLVSLSSCS